MRQGQIYRKYGFVKDLAVVVQYRKYGKGETPIVKPSLATPNNDFTNAVLPPGTAPVPAPPSTGRKRGAPATASSGQHQAKKVRVASGSAPGAGPVVTASSPAQTRGNDPFRVVHPPHAAAGATVGASPHGYIGFQAAGTNAPAPGPHSGPYSRNGYGQGAGPPPRNPRAQQFIDLTEDDENEDDDQYPTAGLSTWNANHRTYGFEHPATTYGNLIRGPVYGGSPPMTAGFPGQTASSFPPARYPTHGQQNRLPGASLFRGDFQPMQPAVQGADLAAPRGFSVYDEQQYIGEEDNRPEALFRHPSPAQPLPAPVADVQAADVPSVNPEIANPQSRDHQTSAFNERGLQNAEFHAADHQSGEFNAEAFQAALHAGDFANPANQAQDDDNFDWTQFLAENLQVGDEEDEEVGV